MHLFLILTVVGGIIAAIAAITSESEKKGSGYSWIMGGMTWVVLTVVLACIRIIPPGYVGVPVVFGKVGEKGLESGAHAVAPYVVVVKYDTRVKNYTMSSTAREGKVLGNDAIMVASSDQLALWVDATILYQVIASSAPKLHQTIGRDYEDKVVRPTTREAIRNAAVQFTAMDAYSTRRVEFKSVILDSVRMVLAGHGLALVDVNLRDVTPPQQVLDSISSKIAALQEAERMQYVLQKAEQEAKVRIAQAHGLAESQRIIQQQLTPLYVQYEAIEAYKSLAGSPNTTFVIMPTSPNGAGLPLIVSPQGTGPAAVK